jgi:AmiR/NasT family two-component response regulator|tara:strand:+ start:713 stop:1309 length:597 start_codon:yes stop_codon:yes gene_type:complete
MCSTESTSELDPSANLRVLIAEDETLIRLDLAETLTELGLVVVGAVGNGQLAVDAARALLPDVVLMDVSMPIRDGISAAQEIIGTGIAPVVLLSAFSQNDLVTSAAEAGTFGYLVKPFTGVEVRAALVLAHARWHQLVDLNRELTRLRTRNAASGVVDRAKAMLQESGMSEEEAFAVLRKSAMDRRLTIAEAAAKIVG